jgi:putative addiction module component (TIGR02574 family)
MLEASLTNAVLALPVEDRLELARRLIESVATTSSVESEISAGVRRIEDVASGKVAPLSQEEFARTLQ